MSIDVFVLLGILFGGIAAVMAFVITYEEFASHRFVSRYLRRKLSLSNAFRAFFFFFVLAVLLGYVLVRTL